MTKPPALLTHREDLESERLRVTAIPDGPTPSSSLTDRVAGPATTATAPPSEPVPAADRVKAGNHPAGGNESRSVVRQSNARFRSYSGL